MSDKVAMDLDIINNTSDNMAVQFTVNRADDLIDNKNQDWSVGISRFYIPTDLLKPYNISSTNAVLNSYKIGLYMPELNGITNIYKSIDLSSYNNSSIVDLMNNCNRAILKNYYDLVRGSGSVSVADGFYGESPPRTFYKASVSKNFIFTKTSSTIYTCKLSSPIANLLLGSGFDCAGLKLSISKFQVAGTTTRPTGFELNLVAPSGKKACMFKNQEIHATSGSPIVYDWQFADWNTGEFNSSNQSGTFYPAELFSKLYEEEATGNWLLECCYAVEWIGAVTQYQVDVDASIEFLARKKDSTNNTPLIPRFPPYLSLNSTNNIEMVYSEKAAISGLRLVLSPALNGIFKLPTNSTVSLGNYKYEIVQLPPVLSTTSPVSEENLLSVTQAYTGSDNSVLASDVYKLVFTTTLPIKPTLAGNTQRSSDIVITDYILEQFDNQYYTFSWSYPNRLFPIISSVGTNSFMISCYIERLDGSRELMYIAPNRRCNLLIEFYKGREL